MTVFYVGIVDRGGEGWGLTFPDLPGCTSGGRDLEDLLSHSVEAVSLWLEDAIAEGEPLPVPRSIRDLEVDPHVIETIHEIGPISFLRVPVALP